MPRNPCKGMEQAIYGIVSRLHVGKTDEQAADFVASKLKKGTSPKIVRQVRACAIKLHHENQKLYGFVMGGRRR